MSIVLCHILKPVSASMQDAALVNGGTGFMGSNFILQWFNRRGAAVVNLDLPALAGDRNNLAALDGTSAIRICLGRCCRSNGCAPSLLSPPNAMKASRRVILLRRRG